VKHAVLGGYVQKLTYKIGSTWPTLNYVEGFAGPWRSRTEDFSDTSPHIAISELLRARSGLKSIGKNPWIRCLFVERDVRKATMLVGSLERYHDVETRVVHGSFLEAVPEVVEFLTEVPRSFTFVFVDPTGWTGFDPQRLEPLLRLRNTEILFTFMTKDIIRFFDHPDSKVRRSFDPLFESQEQRDAWSKLRGRNREDAIVAAFSQWVRKLGLFKYVVSAIVLHPIRNRTHFHLIYATRNIEGLRTFREVEGQTLGLHKSLREGARQRDEVARTGQPSLFGPGTVEGGQSYVDELRDRYHATARGEIRERLELRREVSFDALDEVSLLHPMTSTRDLKAWLSEWKREGLVVYAGLEPTGRTLKPRSGHRVVWLTH
jgi:three-Cys-motif partner protein